MKKFIIKIFLFGTIIFLVSCEDFLNLSPVSEIAGSTFYRNDKELESGVIGIYDGMQNYIQTEWPLAEMRSDNTHTRAQRSEGEWREFETMNVQVINSTVSKYWIDNYNVIFRANTVLENLDNMTSESLKKQFEGEAKFARALSHFNLVRAFGDIPVIDKIIKYTDKEYFARDPESEVYDLIKSDLTTAVANLPTRANIAFGRATKGAAQAILAKVYLTLKDYSSAKTLLDGIISDGDYILLTKYNDVFYKEKNNEIIFGVQYIQDDTKDSQNFSYQWTENGLNYPTTNLMNTVDPADLRKPTLFFWNPLAGATGDWENGKFCPSSLSQTQGNDWIVIRYADVLLMHAEAIMGNNTSTTDLTALSSFNAVRVRAGLPTVATLTKDLLLQERRIELCFENQRLYDLIRFGVAETVMAAFSLTTEPGFTFEPTALLLPIPQRERNIYKELTQNPGY